MSDSQQPVDAGAVAASRDSLQAALDALATAVEGHADVIKPENAHARALSGIREDVVGLGEKLAEDRLLRLGVVGQVKAGKSSLLNLLLFDGKEVLPKAATPMTASLTHITKSDRDEIEVEYYTEKDWAKIEEHAKTYRQKKAERGTTQEPFMQASHELVEMAEKRGLQVGQYLGRKKTEPASVSVSVLNDKLTSLVGSAGKLTPLVKSVSIRCGQGVPDLDIVDTPGINDPIGSRSRRAEKMLVDCDAVLLLSYAGQFMDNEDVRFFEQRLRKEGISNRVIIGSKFDSALIDVARDAGADLQRARDETERRLAMHATDAIRRLSEKPDDDQPAPAAPEIIFISAMCSKLARTPYGEWDHEERSIFERVRKAYRDWLDAADESNATITDDTKTTLTDLGNQAQVTDHLDKLRRNKEQVIFASNQETVDAKRAAASNEVDELLEGLRTYRKTVNEVDAEQLEKQMKAVVGLQHRLTTLIGDEWHKLMETEVAPLAEFRREIRAEAKEARKELKGTVDSKTRTREKKGLWSWTKRLFGAESGWEKYEDKVLNISAVESVIEDVSADVNDGVDKLRDQMFTDAGFVRKSHGILCLIVANELSNDTAQDCDVDALQASLRDAIATVAADARSELKKKEELQIKEPSLDPNDVDKGLKKARKAIRSAINHAIEWIEQADEELRRIAQEAEDELVPVTVAFLKESQEQLKKDIEDRAFKTSRIDSALREIEQGRSGLIGVGAPPDGTEEATN